MPTISSASASGVRQAPTGRSKQRPYVVNILICF
jgi:hypothetical protein